MVLFHVLLQAYVPSHPIRVSTCSPRFPEEQIMTWELLLISMNGKDSVSCGSSVCVCAVLLHQMSKGPILASTKMLWGTLAEFNWTHMHLVWMPAAHTGEYYWPPRRSMCPNAQRTISMKQWNLMAFQRSFIPKVLHSKGCTLGY